MNRTKIKPKYNSAAQYAYLLPQSISDLGIFVQVPVEQFRMIITSITKQVALLINSFP